MTISCPECESANVKETTENHKFKYGSQEDSPVLEADILVLTCLACSFEFLEYRAEEVMDKIIQQHLANRTM